MQLIEKDEVLSLVPHRGRMFLLSRVTKYDLKEYSVEAEYNITEDCLFHDPAMGGVPAWVGFEFIAQAISVLFGLKRREAGKEPKIGFLMSISSMKTVVPVLKTGSVVTLIAKEISRIETVHSFKGLACIDGKTVLEGKLTAMDVDEERMEAYQKGYESIG